LTVPVSILQIPKLGEKGRSLGAHENQGRVKGQPEYLMGATYERPINTRHLKSCLIFIRRNPAAVNTISRCSIERQPNGQPALLQTFHSMKDFFHGARSICTI
jgi:hypothetical protein